MWERHEAASRSTTTSRMSEVGREANARLVKRLNLAPKPLSIAQSYPKIETRRKMYDTRITGPGWWRGYECTPWLERAGFWLANMVPALIALLATFPVWLAYDWYHTRPETLEPSGAIYTPASMPFLDIISSTHIIEIVLIIWSLSAIYTVPKQHSAPAMYCWNRIVSSDPVDWAGPSYNYPRKTITIPRYYVVRPLLDPRTGQYYLTRMTYPMTIVRILLIPIDLLFFGWLRPMWHQRRQTWADTLVGCVVLRDPYGEVKDSVIEPRRGILEAR